MVVTLFPPSLDKSPSGQASRTYRAELFGKRCAQADGREDDTTCARVYARDENHRYAVHHRAPPRQGASACAYRVQSHRQQRQDHLGQERHVPQRAGVQEAESQARAILRQRQGTG